MSTRKPRGSGNPRRPGQPSRNRRATGPTSSSGAPSSRRTPRAGQRGGPFDEQVNYDRNLGPVSGRTKNRARHATTNPGQRTSGGSEAKSPHQADGERLQKVMAASGVASRRVCEDLIVEGRVEVNGTIVRELGTRVDPETAVIVVDGIRINTNPDAVYYAFNKPRGVISTMNDPEGRPCISDYLEGNTERLFHVGRLDNETEGLLLLTNDGELANRLSHPSYEVQKTYLVQVPGPMAKGVGTQLRDGVDLGEEDGMVRVDSFRLVDSTPGHVLCELKLHSGQNRVVRRMMKAVGYPVERLVRVQHGPITLGDQRQGTVRVLNKQEIGHLMAEVGL